MEIRADFFPAFHFIPYIFLLCVCVCVTVVIMLKVCRNWSMVYNINLCTHYNQMHSYSKSFIFQISLFSELSVS